MQPARLTQSIRRNPDREPIGANDPIEDVRVYADVGK
jgi:hypothetical protein